MGRLQGPRLRDSGPSVTGSERRSDPQRSAGCCWPGALPVVSRQRPNELKTPSPATSAALQGLYTPAAKLPVAASGLGALTRALTFAAGRPATSLVAPEQRR